MEVDLDTPRTLIQGLIDAADTNETERPVRRRRVTRTPENNRLSRSLPSTEIKLSQQNEDNSVVVDGSTPKKRVFTRKRRESLVDSVRRKRFHFQRAELSKSYTQSMSNSPFTMDDSLEPRRKSPRLNNQPEMTALTSDISSITNKVSWLGHSKRKKEKTGFKFTVEHDSPESPHEEQQTAYSFRSPKDSPRKQVTSNISRSSPRKEMTPVISTSFTSKEVNSSVSRSSHRNQTTSSIGRSSPGQMTSNASASRSSPRTPRSSTRNQVTSKESLRSQLDPNISRSSPGKQSTPTSRSSPRKQLTPILSRSSPKKQTTTRADRSPTGRQLTPTQKQQQHLTDTESASESIRRTPDSFKISPSKIRTSTPRPGKKSNLTIEKVFYEENTTLRHNNKENASSARSKSFLSDTKGMTPMSEDNMKSLETSVVSPSRSSIPTLNHSSERTLGILSKSPRSTDFERVKQSGKKQTPTQPERKSQSKLTTTPRSLRNSKNLTTAHGENILARTPPADQPLGVSEGLLHDTLGRETAITPAFERTALGPKHSSPVSRTVHISINEEENLPVPDVSVIESREKTFLEEDLDRTEFRLKTPHLGPARPHAPTPSDTPVSTPAPIHPAKQPVKDKQANRANTTKKPRTKVLSRTIPATIIKQTFSHFCKMRVDKDTLPELVKITDEYFDRVYKDLEVFAHHAGRKTIDEKDAELLLKRQKFISNSTSLTHLVEKHLPLELRQELIPMARSGNKIFPRH